MSSNPMYNILGKLKSVFGAEEAKPSAPAEPVYESVEPRGSITEAVKSLESKYETFKLNEADKPDFLDLDKDGDKKEPMKKAAKDAKSVKEGEEITDLDAYQFSEPDKDALLTPAQAKKAAAERRRKLQDIEDRRSAKDDWYSSKDKPSNVRVHHAKYQDDADLDEDMSSQELASRRKEAFAAHDEATAEYGMFTGAETGFGAMKKKKIKPIDKEDDLDEVAPPGAKAERMVKHIKKGYAKDGKLTKKEKGIAYATAWKAHNKGQVEEGVEFKDTIKNSKAELKKAKLAKVTESRMLQEGDYFYEKVGKALAEKNPTLNTASPDFVTAVRQEMVAQGIEPNRARNIIMMDEDFISDVATSYGHYCKEIAECGVPMNSHLGGGMEELDEIARLAGLQHEDMLAGAGSTLEDGANVEELDLEEADLWEEEMGEGNEFSGALAKAKAAGAKEFEVDGKKYTVKEDVQVNVTANGEEDSVKLIRKLAGLSPLISPLASFENGTADDTATEVAEERDIEHANTPDEEVFGVDASIPSGTDLNRSKKQDPATANKAANPLTKNRDIEESLWKSYEDMINDVKE